MFVNQILDLARLRLDDVVKDAKGNYLWSNDELLSYYNDSERELASESRMIYDASTAAICQYDIFPGLPTISIDRRIVEINSAYLTNAKRPLFRKSAKYFDSHIALWGWQSTGWRSVQEMPIYYIPNYEPRKLRFYPYYPTTYQSIVYIIQGVSNISFNVAGTIAYAPGGLLTMFPSGTKMLVSGTTNNNGVLVSAGGTQTLLNVTGTVVTEATTSALLTKKIDTLNLEVARVPLVEVAIQNIATASPEVDADYHMDLIDGILALAYLKRDSETYNLQEAMKYKKMWEDDISDAKSDQIIITESDEAFEPAYGSI
jgi:hypothetical protein